ncbi:MAG: hypothetical protein ACOQNY_01230 [Mycoplasmoidaceae bacterium]
MGYSIGEIKNNTWNHYKYHYLDHLTTVIDIRQNYWSIAIDLYSINNFNLPINSLAGDLQIPYQQIKDIPFNLASDQSLAKSSVEHNADYCKIYSTFFNIDVSQNEFFKQDLSDTLINFDLTLFIDPEAAKAAGSLDQATLDKLINETQEQRWSFEMYYTNTYLIQQTDIIDNIIGYSLQTGHSCMPTIRRMKLSSASYVDMITPFNNLAHIESLSPFQVISAKVKFYYWIELAVEPKILEKVLTVDRLPTKQITISFNETTLYDFAKDEVILSPIGIKGFNIPKYSNGYYELELQITQDNTINKFIIKNDFNFTQNEIQPYISIIHHRIESLEGFKEVKF